MGYRMRAIVCTSLADARSVRDALDRSFGFPKPGYNPSRGVHSGPGEPGWTATIAEIIDVGGVVYVVGVADEIARTILRTSIDVEPVGFGTAYVLEIGGWNGQTPILVERTRAITPTTSDLDAAKADAIRILETRKLAAMAAGFEHPSGSGHRFSLAVEAQILRTRLMLVYQTPAMTWPLLWPTLDPSNFLTLATPADVEALYIAESLALRSLNEADAARKARVAAATTVGQIRSILDAS